MQRILFFTVIFMLSYISFSEAFSQEIENTSAMNGVTSNISGNLEDKGEKHAKGFSGGNETPEIKKTISEIKEILLGEIPGKFAELDSKLDMIAGKLEKNEAEKAALKQEAKKAFDKAQKLADDGMIKEAGFYYAAACAGDPSEGLYLYGYVKAILNWADRAVKRKAYSAALRGLYDMRDFLYSSPAGLNPFHAESVAGLIKEIDDKITYLQKESEVRIAGEKAAEIEKILLKTQNLLSAPFPEGTQALEDTYDVLENTRGALLDLSGGALSPAVKKAVRKISEKIKTVVSLIDTEKYLKEGSELLSLASAQKNPYFAARLISEASLVSARISLTAEDAPLPLKRRVLIFGEDLAKASAVNAKALSAPEFEKLKTRYAAALKTLVENKTNANQALDILADIRNEIIAGSAKISYPDYIKSANGLLTALNGEAEKWREIQARRYEVWAVKTLRRFYDTYKNEMGPLGSGSDTKDRLYAGMKDYLCPIEPRYLGPAGLKAYTEVFDFFYKELDRERRLSLSSEFVDCEKKPLSFF